MNLQPGEARAIVAVSERHPHETLTISIVLEQGIGWTAVSVESGTGARRQRYEYIVSPSGRTWLTSDGTPSGRHTPPIIEVDAEEDIAGMFPFDDVDHVRKLVDHLAHLEEEQIDQVRNTLNMWKEKADARAAE